MTKDVKNKGVKTVTPVGNVSRLNTDLNSAPAKAVGCQRASERQEHANRDKTHLIEELYRSCWADLCRWLRSRFGLGPPEPEDIAQSAFEKITALDDVETIRDPRAFLFTIAARDAVSGYRSRERAIKYIDEQLQIFDLEVGEISPERVYMAREQLNAVARDLQELKPKQREVVLRSRVLGQNYDEISAETGWSTSAISRHMISAMTTILQKHDLSKADDAEKGQENDS